jgi:ectoine hydroxylase-related dioxygenase (phytanoyl-CoA dioxygenase family)
MDASLMDGLERDGFAIVRGVLDRDDIAILRAEAERVAAEAVTVCVRHLRQRSALFNQLSRSARIVQCLPAQVAPVRSILFDKTADNNWPVAWHRDLTIAVQQRITVAGFGPWSVKDGVAHVQPPMALLQRMVTARIHLDDATLTNGALMAIPGSHRWALTKSSRDPQNESDAVVWCACAAGDLLLMSPLLLHASRRSVNPRHRRVAHFEYAARACLDPRLSWHEPGMTNSSEASAHCCQTDHGNFVG